MLNMKYALEKGGPKRLEIAWQTNHSEFHIKLDGKEIASFTSPEPLLAGQEFTLEDGSILKIQLPSRSKFAAFKITFNGFPLPSSMPPPEKRLKTVFQFILFIAAMNIIGSIASFRSFYSMKYLSPNAWILAAVGLIFLVLALFVYRKSKIALFITVSLFTLDTIVFLFYAKLMLWKKVLMFLFRLLLILMMLMGFGAINEIKQKEIDEKKKTVMNAAKN